ncbi:MAG TPA: hypothetical protein VHQ65_16605 [Thermoanaerobaculia bacterium]|nr:hypothetical protein [Thermoanaerobaculia bacterium]
MIRFLTLLLGLVIGPWPVALDVGPDVARVDLLLDGVEVASVAGEPWQATVDLGEELAPHHLVAVARGADGAELGRTEQWINLGPSPLEVELDVERDEAGKPVAARVIWQSVEDLAIERVTLSLDGEPLPLDERYRAALPPLPQDALGLLQAEVVLASGAAAQAGRLLGGRYGEHSEVGLTTVPLRVGRRLPRGTGKLAWLRVAGEPAAAVAVERGDADILVVTDRSALPELDSLKERYERWVAKQDKSIRGLDTANKGVNPALTLLSGGLDPGDRVWYVAPEAERVRPAASPAASAAAPGQAAWLFRRFGPVGVELGGLPNQLLRLNLPPAAAPQRLADAVATAGRDAYGSGRPRAVLAVVGPGMEDASIHRFQAVRRYLGSLGVPLHVWYVEHAPGRRYNRVLRSAGAPPSNRDQRLADAEARLGPVTDVSRVGALIAATAALREDLDSQQIVWIEGRFLPSAVTLVEPPRGVSLLDGAAAR